MTENESGFSVNFADFDKKFAALTNNTIPELAEQANMEIAAMILNDAVTQDPTVPKGHARAKAGTRAGVGGTLRQSGKIERQSDGTVLVGFDMPYAAYQHEGKRADGTRVVEHWTEPGSGKEFLSKKLKMNRDVYLKKAADFVKARSGE